MINPRFISTIPAELLDQNALFKFEPRLRILYRQLRTHKGVERVVRRRLENRRKDLTPSQRAARIRSHCAKLMKLDISERVRMLFIKEERRPTGWAVCLVNEDGDIVRELFHLRRIEPAIILDTIYGQTELPVSLGLPTLLRDVREFVQKERKREHIEVRRGRKPGQRGPGIDLGPALRLAYLALVRHVPRAELLRLADRARTPDGYHWLSRRIDLARPYLEHVPAVKSDFDKLETKTLKWQTRMLLHLPLNRLTD